MSETREENYQPKFLENSLLVIVGLLAHLPLHYQLTRWANGLDPTFVRAGWLAQTPFPFASHLLIIHPIIWLLVTVFAFLRICRNYGWRLSK
jgi:hypothetical protein